MCGILTIFGEEVDAPGGLLVHRGPDAYMTKTIGKCRMDFYRLKINDLTDAGMQPFTHKNHMLTCNGEIYNHKEFRTGAEKGTSDCEVLIPLIEDYGIMKTVELIRGDFAFTYTDGKRVLAARDPYGVRPLFFTRYDQGSIAFASEVKALMFMKSEIFVFPPGYIYDSALDDFVCYHNSYWNIFKHVSNVDIGDVKTSLESAVMKRLESTDRETGFLLSGGLDSSLIASIAAKKLGKIKTFSVGTQGSPDLKAARLVSEYIGSEHTEVYFTPKEGIEIIYDVIKSIESYDTTTIRASVPMWILCRYIKEHTDCRYIFSGEGADEILGGYLYFHNAPGVEEFALENMRRLRLIHQFDGLRADRCASAHGLDLIVPFLDKDFVDTCMNMNQNEKLGKIEKAVLRKSFNGYLPEEILWRRKDGMSDAVGTDWVRAIKDYANTYINDRRFSKIKDQTRGYNVPLTKEEALYRELFWKIYDHDNDHLISEIWRPKWTCITDPSARLLIDEPFT
jgi:asparagine synthase (glutamine-hydrolysing)